MSNMFWSVAEWLVRVPGLDWAVAALVAIVFIMRGENIDA